jgi:hypothetical protein
MDNNGGHNSSNNGASGNKDVLYLMGGVALIALGAGLVMTHPTVRKTVSGAIAAVLPELKGGVLPDLTALGPDIERYMKLRSM